MAGEKSIDGRYRILQRIGRGVSGEVYKVADLKDDTFVALKLLNRRTSAADMTRRFKREFRVLAGLRHPNLCPVYDFGILGDGRCYYTMEYINGSDILKVSRRFSGEQILTWIVQLCRVLEYIHSRGLIHFDIKPGNVLIQRPGDGAGEAVLKLMDFGLVGIPRHGGSGFVKGTIPYIAPEIIRGLPVDHRADLYSLGVLMAEIFSRHRFRRPPRSRSSGRQESSAWSRAGSLPEIINRLTEDEPDKRFNRTNEVIAAINKLGGFGLACETPQIMAGYLLSSRFVGRADELERLKNCYANSIKGVASIVLISGDAGIGKSRILREFRVYIQLKGGRCFSGGADKDRFGVLEPFHDILRAMMVYLVPRDQKMKQALAILFRIFPDLAADHGIKGLPKFAPLNPESERLRIFEALFTLFDYAAKRIKGFVLFLEDLQWADRLTFQFIEHLIHNLTRQNILICAAIRRDALEDGGRLQKTITGLREGGYLKHVELGPLTLPELRLYLESLAVPDTHSRELARCLKRQTGGNPYFVEEMLRALFMKSGLGLGYAIEDLRSITIPKTIEGLISDRLRGLGEGSRQVVGLAAVMGRAFDFDTMARLSRIAEHDLTRAVWELRTRKILVEGQQGYYFYHEVLREIVYQNLSMMERRRLHRRVARIIEGSGRRGDGELVARLAHHFIRAGDRRKGMFYGRRAAENSRLRHANESALGFYRGVLGLLGKRPQGQRLKVLLNLAEIEMIMADYGEAERHYRMAMAIAPLKERIKINLGMSNIQLRKGDYRNALKFYRRGLGLIRRLPKGGRRNLLETYFRVRIFRAYQIIGQRPRSAVSLFRSTSFRPGGLRDADSLAMISNIYHNLGTITSIMAEYGTAGYDTAIAYYKTAHRYYRRLKDEERIAGVLNDLAIGYYMKRNYRRALVMSHRSASISRGIGDYYGLAMALSNQGNILRDRGDLPKAVQNYEQVLSIGRRTGNDILCAAAFLGLAECFSKIGRMEETEHFANQSLAILARLGWTERRIPGLINIAQVHQSRGEFKKARRLLRQALRIAGRIKQERVIAVLICNIGTIFYDLGMLGRAERYFSRALIRARNLKSAVEEIECAMQLAGLYFLKGESTLARHYYLEVRRLIRGSGLRSQTVQIRRLLIAAELSCQTGNFKQGLGFSSHALRLARALDAGELSARALLAVVKNEMGRGRSLTEMLNLLEKAYGMIDCRFFPDTRWQIDYHRGQLCEMMNDYSRALDYYQRCVLIFRETSGRLAGEERRCYLGRPDRKAVFKAVDRIEQAINSR